jgi:hypothetical protein
VSDHSPDDEDPEDLPPETTKLVDPAAGRRARDRQKRQAEEEEALWRGVLALPEGRRAVWRLIADPSWGHAFNTSFACGPTGFPQPEATMHAMGMQQLALRFYHDLLRIDHAGVRLMHAEMDGRFAKPKRTTRRPDATR